MRILILTDHRSHSSENSLYALARQIAAHAERPTVHAASRGNLANTAFFEARERIALQACVVGNDFDFQLDGRQFLEQTISVEIGDYDWIFLRLPRPIPDDFFPFLTQHFPDRRIINRPSGIEETSSKAFLTQIPDVCPPIRLCTQWSDIYDFYQQFPIVLKPLKEYGGKGILKLADGKVWEGNKPEALDLADFAAHYQQNPRAYLAMKFLQRVSDGDKRIIVANGRILAASMRVPAPGAWMCNVAQGGSSYSTEADSDERAIVERISPLLLAKGIFLYGLDTLAEDDGRRRVSEINTLSIGGIAPSERNSGKPIVKAVIDEFFEYIYQQQ